MSSFPRAFKAGHDMIFAKQLAGGGETRQFTIDRGERAGWVACEADGRSQPKTSVMRDWRQVEAAMALFERKACALRDEGWTEI